MEVCCEDEDFKSWDQFLSQAIYYTSPEHFKNGEYAYQFRVDLFLSGLQVRRSLIFKSLSTQTLSDKIRVYLALQCFGLEL